MFLQCHVCYILNPCFQNFRRKFRLELANKSKPGKICPSSEQHHKIFSTKLLSESLASFCYSNLNVWSFLDVTIHRLWILSKSSFYQGYLGYHVYRQKTFQEIADPNHKLRDKWLVSPSSVNFGSVLQNKILKLTNKNWKTRKKLKRIFRWKLFESFKKFYFLWTQ